MLTMVILIALIILSVIQLARSFALTEMGNWFERQLSQKVFTNAIKAALIQKGSGSSQQLRDLQTIKTFITSPAAVAVMDVPWAFIFFIVLFLIHPYMGFLTLIGGFILLFLAFLTDKITKPLHDSSNEKFILSMRQVDQATRNAEVVEVMGMSGNIIKSWQETNSVVQNTQNLVNNRQAVLSEITKFVRMLLQILTTGIGAYLVVHNEMSTGAIIASSSLSGRALAPFEQAMMAIKGYINCKKAYERLEGSLSRVGTTDERMYLPEPEGNLSVEGLFFAPQGSQKHILRGIEFAVKPGEITAVIGPSASGKTTLAKILVGIYTPSMGHVRIDGASLKDWNREQLGKYVGYLPQDIELFSGTVRSNIARMNQESDPEAVIKAAQLAGVHEMILQLPNGYDTEIGVDGSVLSGGQRQRLGLARAFYGDPKILILDEPNSNLDSSGEQALEVAIKCAKEMDMTVIIISHRTPLLAVADKILVMKDGMIALFGPRDEVMQKMSQAPRIPNKNMGA